MSPDAVVGGSPVPQASQPADLSSRTVTMLVVLTLIISFLGAWMNLHQASLLGADRPVDDGVAASSARVSFTIDPPEQDSSSAIVGFVIAPPANGP